MTFLSGLKGVKKGPLKPLRVNTHLAEQENAKKEHQTALDVLVNTKGVTLDKINEFHKRFTGDDCQFLKEIFDTIVNTMTFNTFTIDLKISNTKDKSLKNRKFYDLIEIKKMIEITVQKLRKLASEDYQHYKSIYFIDKSTYDMTILQNNLIIYKIEEYYKKHPARTASGNFFVYKKYI